MSVRKVAPLEIVLTKIERGVMFGATQVTDLTPLAGLKSLQSITCHNTQVTDLTPLAGLKSLQSIHCGATQVTDLTPLAGLKS
ncbi:MAG: leucine-rich repeat domain-containing protein, partial [Roseobacter sp.]